MSVYLPCTHCLGLGDSFRRIGTAPRYHGHWQDVLPELLSIWGTRLSRFTGGPVRQWDSLRALGPAVGPDARVVHDTRHACALIRLLITDGQGRILSRSCLVPYGRARILFRREVRPFLRHRGSHNLCHVERAQSIVVAPQLMPERATWLSRSSRTLKCWESRKTRTTAIRGDCTGIAWRKSRRHRLLRYRSALLCFMTLVSHLASGLGRHSMFNQSAANFVDGFEHVDGHVRDGEVHSEQLSARNSIARAEKQELEATQRRTVREDVDTHGVYEGLVRERYLRCEGQEGSRHG